MTGPEKPRLVSSQTASSLAVLALTFVAGALILIWLWQDVLPADGIRTRKDPRVLPVILFVATVGLPAIHYRRRRVPQGLSGWPRVGFTALGTGMLLGLCWLAVWTASRGGFGMTFLADALRRMADLSPPATRWNAGGSLVLGVWFWITSYFVASAGRTPGH